MLELILVCLINYELIDMLLFGLNFKNLIVIEFMCLLIEYYEREGGGDRENEENERVRGDGWFIRYFLEMV